MAIFVTIDEAGAATGFYDTALIAVPPTGAFEITSEQWEDWVVHQASRRWVNGMLSEIALPAPETVPVPQPTKADLMAQIQALLAKVEAMPDDAA